MKRLNYLLMPLVLSACANQPGSPVEVKIPVPVYVPCQIAMPEKPKPCIPKEDTRPEILRCWLIERETIKPYIAELETGLSICTRSD